LESEVIGINGGGDATIYRTFVFRVVCCAAVQKS
jgi:hypothetical protein